MMYNTQLKIFLFLLLGLCNTVTITAIAKNDTTRVYFKLDNPDLEQSAAQKVDSLLYHDIINASQQILIVGYADHLGSNAYNDTLSAKRANNVKTYLQQMGIPATNITLCQGKGEVPRDVELPDGYAADRRVDIVYLSSTKKILTAKTPAIKKETAEKLIESKDAVTLNTTTPLNPETVTTGQLFVLDRIFFHTGRQAIVKESLPELEYLFRILSENPTLTVRIEGHVCCVPPSLDALDIDTGEIALSVNRARYICAYLIKKGIEKERLSYIGYGKSRPLSKTEYTMEEQDLNKRVEMRVMKR